MSRIGPNGREEWIICQTRERAPAERAAFLDGACAGDLGLRERLEALLTSPDEPDPLLTTQASAGRATVKVEFPDGQPDEAVGQTLGRYKLLEKVGEGGCGVVYVAEQTEPVRRRVALKVIKLGMDTKAVVARFEAERQALAMMDHPNIARVLDAGTSETGRPFFVMELVRGIRITDYCDQAWGCCSMNCWSAARRSMPRSWWLPASIRCGRRFVRGSRSGQARASRRSRARS